MGREDGQDGERGAAVNGTGEDRRHAEQPADGENGAGETCQAGAHQVGEAAADRWCHHLPEKYERVGPEPDAQQTHWMTCWD